MHVAILCQRICLQKRLAGKRTVPLSQLKKVGDTDYCALHAVDKKPAKPVDQCCAMTWEGTRCTRKPDEGYRYCAQHRKQPVSAAKKAAPQPKKK